MSVFGDVGIAAAERLERSLGPAVGLRSYRKLYGHDDPAVRQRAVLSAVRCARATGDHAALREAAHAWRPLRRADDEMIAVIRSLVAERRYHWALPLAEAEAARRDDGRGHYLLGRVRLAAGELPKALASFDVAVRKADDARIAVNVALVRMRYAGLEEAERSALAGQVHATMASRSQRMLLAEAQLRAPSRFVRAKGLSLLEEVGREPDALGRAAIARAAAHADAAGPRLTWVEADRIEAALSHHPDEAAREQARAALAALREQASDATDSQREALRTWPDGQRYLDLAEGVMAGLDVTPEVLGLDADHPLAGATTALSALAALGRGDHEAARRHLAALPEVEEGMRVEPPQWTAWQRCLEHGDAALRRLALPPMLRALARSPSPPPRGYLSLVPTLRRAGEEGQRLDLLRRAAARGEPTARDHLVRELSRRGWEAHADGDRRRALAWLREAKLISGG